MIDLHTHIMPFIDDGSDSIEMTKKMLEMEIENGVTDVVLTPHMIKGKVKSIEEYQKSYKTVLNIINSNDLNINVYMGSEIFMFDTTINDLRNGVVKPFVTTNNILVELSLTEMYSYEEIEKIIRDLNLKYNVILAHPERYHYLRIEDLFKLSKYAKMQINTGSIIGVEGAYIKRRAFQILRNGIASLIASDCHDIDLRRPNLLESRKIVEKKFGIELAVELYDKNPLEIIKDIRKNWLD